MSFLETTANENSTEPQTNSTENSENLKKSPTDTEQESKQNGTPIDEPISPKTWKEKITRSWSLLRLTHEAAMIGKFERQNKIVEDQVKTMLKNSGQGSGPEEGDEMGVSVGNENHYHIQVLPEKPPDQPKPDPPAPPDPPRPDPPRQPTSRYTPFQAAMIAALLSTGVVGPLAYWAGRPGVDTDTDTATDVRPGFGEPEDYGRLLKSDPPER